MSDDTKLQIVSQQIPHVWFDIIGRVVPGAFLLWGLVEAGYFQFVEPRIKEFVTRGSFVEPVVVSLVFIGFFHPWFSTRHAVLLDG
jgi:hypothetical protein